MFFREMSFRLVFSCCINSISLQALLYFIFMVLYVDAIIPLLDICHNRGHDGNDEQKNNFRFQNRGVATIVY